jgi:hypothetical protein
MKKRELINNIEGLKRDITELHHLVNSLGRLLGYRQALQAHIGEYVIEPNKKMELGELVMISGSGVPSFRAEWEKIPEEKSE